MKLIVGTIIGFLIIYNACQRYQNNNLQKYFSPKVEKYLRVTQGLVGLHVAVACIVFLFINKPKY